MKIKIKIYTSKLEIIVSLQKWISSCMGELTN